MRDYASLLPVVLEDDLYAAGWNGAISPYPGITPKQFAMQALRRSLVKKFLPRNTALQDRAALDLFLTINRACSEFAFRYDQLSEIETIAIGEAKAFLYNFCFPNDSAGESLLEFKKVSEGFGLGNGANIGAKTTDFLSKVGTSTMAATSPFLHQMFLQAVGCDPLWSELESVRSATRGYQLVKGSRLSFVPKNSDISRTICTEPVCNMLWQKGIAHVIEGRLREVVGIDLSTQPDKNRKLAQLGSTSSRFGTIDLSSASDSMSMTLVREFLPASFVRWLEWTRSPVAILPGGEVVELHMVSSMGNAFTFPLQTTLFTSLVYGAYRALGIKPENPRRSSLGNFAVFGDDIIVERQAYGLVTRLLSFCGFSVNVDKSFNEGLFRESCGQDFYNGYDVRGIYIKSLNTANDSYSACNRLNVWSAKHGIYLPRLVKFILRGNRFLPVPYDEMDVAGLRVPSSLLRKKLVDRHTGAVKYRCYVGLPSAYSVTDVESQPPGLNGWFHNPSAVLFAALAGTLRSGRVAIRSSQPFYRLKERRTPCWDYVVPGRGLCPSLAGEWKTAVEVNCNFLFQLTS